VKLSAAHFAKELERRLAGWKDLVLAGPAPAPLLRAESHFRHQIMLRTKSMARLAAVLAQTQAEVNLPDDVQLSIDVDPVNLV
jgi:primosomal protein N'